MRRLIGHVAIAGVVLGMIAGLALPRLEGVRAGEAPDPTPVETSAPATTVSGTVVDTTLATAAVTTEVAVTTVATPAPPTTADPATSTEPAPPTSTEKPDTPDVEPLGPDDTYDVTVVAVCVDGTTPVASFTNNSTADIRVSIGGPEPPMVLSPGGMWPDAPWPRLESGEPDTIAKWDALSVDSTGEPTADFFVDGRLDVPSDCPPPPPPTPEPGPPEQVTSTPGDGTVTLSWQPPTHIGDSPIFDYIIEQRQVHPVNEPDWTVLDDGVGPATSLVVSGLTNGATYMFRIAAVNGQGPGEPVEAKDTPRTVPSAVALVAAPTNVSGQIRLTWTPGFDGGTEITDYVIHRSLNGTSGWTLVSDGVSNDPAYTATGMTNGTRFYFRVFAVNDVGLGAASNVANAIPRTPPSAARSLTAAPTNLSGQVRVAWLAPASNGGSPITDYVLQRSLNGTSGWTTIGDGVNVNRSFTVGGLANGVRYYFRVYARNAAGQSPVSNLANAIPRFVLTAPRSLTAVPTNLSGQIRLSWLAPLSNGGRPITDYVIQVSRNGTSGWSSITDGVSAATSRTVTGLANATRYYFRVFARTGTITGPGSNSATAIPRTRPGAPVGLVAYASYAGYSLDWIAPRANGAVITDYLVQFRNRAGAWVSYPDGVSRATSAWFAAPGYKCTDIRVAAVNAAGVGAFSYVLGSCFR